MSCASMSSAVRLRHLLSSSRSLRQIPIRFVNLMGPFDPRTPDDVEPGEFGRVKERIPVEGGRSYRQRMSEFSAKRGQRRERQIDIGLPLRTLTRREVGNERDGEELAKMEKLARERRLTIDLEQVEMDWECESGPEHVLAAARHYRVMQHLFGDEHFFHPVVPFRAFFCKGEEAEPACMGNVIAPAQCQTAPDLRWLTPDSPSLWTVLMVSPDEHLHDAEGEYAHWLVTNATSGSELNSGDLVIPYLPPLPAKGTGLQRFALLLFYQSQPISVPACGSPDPTTGRFSLNDRSFNVRRFYAEYQDWVTPAGLCFFQAEWDESVRENFRLKTDLCAEPAYEFSWPRRVLGKMQQFAFAEPFNLYMDKYRDVKDINEEVLKEKLKSVHPFKGRLPPESKYPLAAQHQEQQGREWRDRLPAWLIEREKEKLLRRGQWKDLD